MPPLTSPAYAFSVESDDPIYEEYSSSDEQEASPCFSKERVSSTEEFKSSGAFKSELRAAVGAANTCAIEDTEDECDPSDSLMIMAPVYTQKCEGLKARLECAVDEVLDSSPIEVAAMELQPPQAAKLDESSDSLQAPLSISDFEELDLTPLQEQQQRETGIVEEALAAASWRQKLVYLFAGRRKSTDSHIHKKRNDSGASSWVNLEDPVSQVSGHSQRKFPDAHTNRGHNSDGASAALCPTLDAPASQPSENSKRSKTPAGPAQEARNISSTPPIQISGQPVSNSLFDKRNGSTRYDSPSRSFRESTPQPFEATKGKDSAQTIPPPQPHQLRPLLLQNVIPPIRIERVLLPIERVEEHIPVRPARKHVYEGYAVIEPDEFEPEIFLHGFPVGANSPEVTVPVDLEHRRNSASNLLDRNGDTWAVWNERNAEHPEDMVFAKRSRSDSELEKKGGVRRPRAGTVKGFLEVIGDQYPYNQGLCW
jgi:hypothetical protein